MITKERMGQYLINRICDKLKQLNFEPNTQNIENMLWNMSNEEMYRIMEPYNIETNKEIHTKSESIKREPTHKASDPLLISVNKTMEERRKEIIKIIEDDVQGNEMGLDGQEEAADRIMSEVYSDFPKLQWNDTILDKYDSKEYELIKHMNKDRLHMMSRDEIQLMCDVVGLLQEDKDKLQYYSDMFSTRLGEIELEQKQVEICKEYGVSIKKRCLECNLMFGITYKKGDNPEEEPIYCNDCIEKKENTHNRINEKLYEAQHVTGMKHNCDDDIINLHCYQCNTQIETTRKRYREMVAFQKDNRFLCQNCYLHKSLKAENDRL